MINNELNNPPSCPLNYLWRFDDEVIAALSGRVEQRELWRYHQKIGNVEHLIAADVAGSRRYRWRCIIPIFHESHPFNQRKRIIAIIMQMRRFILPVVTWWSSWRNRMLKPVFSSCESEWNLISKKGEENGIVNTLPVRGPQYRWPSISTWSPRHRTLSGRSNATNEISSSLTTCVSIEQDWMVL